MKWQLQHRKQAFSVSALTLVFALFLLVTSCSKSSKIVPVIPIKTFVLVHGSWQGPYAWQYVQARLQAVGQKVVVVELPGHGQDQTPPVSLTLNSYRNKVVSAITAINGPVVLVGHSLGGAIITAVADTIPSRIEKLVYLAGFVPTNGQSVLDLTSTDSASLLGPAIVPSPDFTTLSVPNNKLLPIFCQDGNDTVNQLLIANNRPEPAIPLTNKISLSNPKSAAIDKYYIHTTLDHAITIDLQNKMVLAAGITNLYSLASSHSPMLSMPDKVTAILLDIIK